MMQSACEAMLELQMNMVGRAPVLEEPSVVNSASVGAAVRETSEKDRPTSTISTWSFLYSEQSA